MASVFTAVILSTLMMSLKEGTYARMTDAVVGAFTGYVQIHREGYWDDQVLDNSFTHSGQLYSFLENHEQITSINPRLESFALISKGEYSRGAMVIGTDVEREFKGNQMLKTLSGGKFLLPDDQAVIVGSGLATFLKADVGDTIVILGQGYHGVNAAGKYPIKGIIKYGSPELSKRLVFIPLKEARQLFDAEEQLTSLILDLKEVDDAKALATKLSAGIGPQYEVLTWEQMLPELKQMFEADRVEGYVFMAILYLVISFGIFGTIVMILAERQHEFGVVVAIGMQRYSLGISVFLEIIIVTLLGAVIGMLGAYPFCLWFYYKPITFGAQFAEIYEGFGFEPVLQASVEPFVFIQQAVVVAILVSIIALYPLFRISLINANKAMRS